MSRLAVNVVAQEKTVNIYWYQILFIMKQNIDEVKRMQQLAGINEAPISLPAGLDVYIDRKGEYILFGGEEGKDKGPFSQYENIAKTMRSFISQLPDGKITNDIEIYGGPEGLELIAKFTTSLSREEVEKLTLIRKKGI